MASEWREVCRVDRVPAGHDVRVRVDAHPVLLRTLDDGSLRVLATDGSSVEHRVVDGLLQLRVADDLPAAG